MKKGRSIVELAQELTRIQANARDFIVPTERLRAEVVNGNLGKANLPPEVLALSFQNGERHSFTMNNWSASQLATYTDIPKSYYDRLALENNKLLAENVNHGLDRAVVYSPTKKEGRLESRFVRTIDGRVRGFLSSRYRPLDSHDLLEAVFPVMQNKEMEIVSSEITEQRVFVKALSSRLKSDVKVGDTVQYGLVISTSDVGAGSVRVEPLLYRLACLNGMISSTAIRKFHVGKNQAEDDIRELLTDRTKELSDAAFWSQVKDVVIGSMRPEVFEREVDRLRLAANEEIKNFDLPRVVELTMKATGILGEGKKNSILAALASGNEGAGLTKWGLINSFTRAAQDDGFSYEESIELERAGGQILELPKSAWQNISATA